MQNLDFLTLYVVIFLHSLTVCVVWAAFALRYRANAAAPYWLIGMALTVVGGAVLAIQGNEGALIPAILGNSIIILGFAQFWIGLRRFQNQPGGQLFAVGFTLLAALCMIAFHDFARGRAIVYAAGQATVMGVCIYHLLHFRQPGVGAVIAAAAFAVAMIGQIMVISTNIGVLIGVLEYPVYYALASYALLCTVFSGAVWNLGFAMMLVDRLQATLLRLSETDELTGVANRRGLKVELDRAKRAKHPKPYTVVMFDLDDFKPLNDTYGHAVGDQALAHLGQLLATEMRASDLVARLGGDEFCVLLVNTTPDEARPIAARLRAKIAASPLRVDETLVQLSVSVGVSTSLASGYGADAILEADNALYEDKALKKSRNSRIDRYTTPP